MLYEVITDDYQFKTIIGYTGKINEKGELKGDLVIKGGADPALGSEYFQDYYFNFIQLWVKDRITSYNVCYTKLLRGYFPRFFGI